MQERSPRPRIFVSYAPSKSLDRESVLTFVKVVKERIGERKWEVVDPMVAPGVEQISKKVHDAIFSSDALIGECTTGAPNVMYEIGAMRGLGRTAILCANPDQQPADQDARKYLAFYGITEGRPIASDLGDIEFLKYGNLSDPAHLREFSERLDAMFQKLEESKLKLGSRILQRQYFSFLPIVNNFALASPAEHPLPLFVAGWLQALRDSFRRLTESVFEIDSDYYAPCLAEFRRFGSQSTKAIADWSDETENFWKANPSPSEIKVDERLFLVDWEALFDSARLGRIAAQVKKHAEQYPVRLGLSRFSWPDADEHPLGRNAIGKHLLLVEPDLVGGYVRRGENTYLRLERDPDKYRKSERAYGQAKNLSFSVDRSSTAENLLSDFRKIFKFGIWDEKWPDDIEGRGENYIDFYDLHIRCWIPKYEQLIEHCSFEVKSAVDQLLKSRPTESSQLRILEVGVGTGALTVPMAAWFDLCNAPFRNARMAEPIQEYVGVDKDQRMVEITRRKVSDIKNVTIEKGTAPDGLRNVLARSGQFDVIFGSLVLHDILGKSTEEHTAQVFRKFGNFLRPGGALIFADVFPHADSSVKNGQFAYWRTKMRMAGLDEAQVEFFLDKNREMLSAPSDERLSAVAKSENFDLKEIGIVPGGDPKSPFRVVRLDKLKQPSLASATGASA